MVKLAHGGEKAAHIALGILELLPLIGAVAAIFERIIVASLKSKTPHTNSSQTKKPKASMQAQSSSPIGKTLSPLKTEGEKRPSLDQVQPPTPIQNYGNSCWMGSCLQALMASKYFEEIVQNPIVSRGITEHVRRPLLSGKTMPVMNETKTAQEKARIEELTQKCKELNKTRLECNGLNKTTLAEELAKARDELVIAGGPDMRPFIEITRDETKQELDNRKKIQTKLTKVIQKSKRGNSKDLTAAVRELHQAILIANPNFKQIGKPNILGLLCDELEHSLNGLFYKNIDSSNELLNIITHSSNTKDSRLIAICTTDDIWHTVDKETLSFKGQNSTYQVVGIVRTTTRHSVSYLKRGAQWFHCDDGKVEAISPKAINFTSTNFVVLEKVKASLFPNL